MVLLNMSPPDAFLALINLVNKSILKSFYAGNLEDMEAYYRIFDTLLADNMPYVYASKFLSTPPSSFSPSENIGVKYETDFLSFLIFYRFHTRNR